jgi:hypothetical protein
MVASVWLLLLSILNVHRWRKVQPGLTASRQYKPRPSPWKFQISLPMLFTNMTGRDFN